MYVSPLWQMPRLYVYRVVRDFREATGGGLRYNVWTRKAERVTR